MLQISDTPPPSDISADSAASRIVTRRGQHHPLAPPLAARGTAEQQRIAELVTGNRSLCDHIARRVAKEYQLTQCITAIDTACRELRRIPQAQMDRLIAYAADTGAYDKDFLPWPSAVMPAEAKARAVREAAEDRDSLTHALRAAQARLDTLRAAAETYAAEGASPAAAFEDELAGADINLTMLRVAARKAGLDPDAIAPSAVIDDDTIEALFGDSAEGAA